MRCAELLGMLSSYPVNLYRGTTADSYLYESVYGSAHEYVINIDEDAFLFDIKELTRLMEHMADNSYAVCGVADGGQMPIRAHNPLSLNPFFNVFHAKTIREIPYEDLMAAGKDFDPASVDADKMTWLKKDQPYAFDDFEPYYPFFVGLHLHEVKTLHLEARDWRPGLYPTLLLNPVTMKPFLLHTWYARQYGTDQATTKVIDTAYEWSKRLAQKSILTQ